MSEQKVIPTRKSSLWHSLKAKYSDPLWQHLSCNDLDWSKEDSQRTYKGNIEARSRNHRCPGKATSFTYSECLSQALVIQRATRMSPVILSSVACLTLEYFSTLSHKQYDFRKESYWTTDFPYNFCLNISQFKNNWARYYDKYIGLSVKYRLFLSDFNETWIF